MIMFFLWLLRIYVPRFCHMQRETRVELFSLLLVPLFEYFVFALIPVIALAFSISCLVDAQRFRCNNFYLYTI